MTSKSNLKTNLIKVEKGYISDLENILQDILLHFTITRNDNNQEKITKDDLMELYITPLLQKEKQYQCSAILVNGNRCSHKSLKDTKYKYCKKHFFKDKQTYNSLGNITEELESGLKLQDDSKLFVINNQIKDDIQLKKDTLEKHFIDNILYYVDEKYIYDENYCKTGYIENDNDNIKNYILITDPFILQNI